MKKQLLFFWALIFGILLSSCNSDDNFNEQQELVKIVSFSFLASNNDDLQQDVIAIIDEANKTIKATLPANTPVSFLKPTIELSQGASVLPGGNFPENFTNPLVYKVFGDNFSESEYTVIVAVEDSTEGEINNFVFRLNENPNANLDEDISGEFDGTTIALVFNSGTDISALTPNIVISRGATISPGNGVKQDFTNPVEYTVTAQDGVTNTVYTVISKILDNDEKEITSFKFSNIGGNNYTATIDGNDIELELPEGTDLSSLNPMIEISDNAVVVPQSGVTQNFNNILQYEVTAENGDTQVFTVNVYTKNSLGSDRAVLTQLYKTNKIQDNLFNGYLNWDLDAPSMNDWVGVTIEDGRVTGLITGLSIRIYILPPSIGDLSALKTLNIGSVALKEIPKEIGNLKELILLDLSFNLIESIPKEIGSLSKLSFLYLSRNKLETLPSELGNLSKLRLLSLSTNKLKIVPSELRNLGDLFSLDLSDNQINELPRELGELTNLRNLDMDENPISVIPREICALSEDNGGNTKIKLDEEDICEE